MAARLEARLARVEAQAPERQPQLVVLPFEMEEAALEKWMAAALAATAGPVVFVNTGVPRAEGWEEWR